MTCDPRTYPFIGHHEGKVLKAYLCPAHVVTIGFGFTMGSKVFASWWRGKHGRALRLGDTITLADALMLLKKVVDLEYLAAVEKAVPGALAHQKGASASMAFNCGLGSLKWEWFCLLKLREIAKAAARLRVTATTAKGRRLPGLVRRRAEEAAILGRNEWPNWLKMKAGERVPIDAALPAAPLQEDDFTQGKVWLKELGYLANVLETDPAVIFAATRRFQSDHKQLTVDGILGRATLDQLQRVVDLKRKLAQSTAGGGVVAGGGAGDQALDLSGIGDVLLYGGLAVMVIGGLYQMWRYRDEIKIAFGRRIAP